jgi:hypothetical protein
VDSDPFDRRVSEPPEIVVIPDFPADLGVDFAADVAPFVTVAAALSAPVQTPVPAPTPGAAPGPAPEPTPVPAPVEVDKPSVFETGGWRTGSDYVGLALTGVAIVLGLGVAGLIGYVVYSIFASIFGALSAAAVGAAGMLPLLLIAGVAFFVFGARGRGGAVAGASDGVATAVRAPALIGLGVVRAVASMPGVPGAATRRARRRGVAGSPAPSRSAGRTALPGFDAGGGQSVPAEFTGTTVSSPLSRAFGRAPRVVAAQPAGSSYATGASKPASLLSRVILGRPAPAAVPMVAARSTWRARLTGAPKVTMVPATAGVSAAPAPSRGSGRLATMLFGSDSATAYFANPGADLGIVGKLRRRSMRGSDPGDPRFVRAGDVPVEWMVDGLTERWVARMRAAHPDGGVIGTFRADGGGWRCNTRFCAVGFLLDESDPNGWYNAGTWATPRYRHRDLEKLYPRYGRVFLWNISNMFDAQQWNLLDCAAHVEQEMGMVK